MIIYQGYDGKSRVEVRFEGDTVWLTQAQLASLYNVTPQNITVHLKNIYAEAELEKEATCKESLQFQLEGRREVNRSVRVYNLDVIISLGYRVNSIIATRFRIWATERLREYIIKGFALDDERLKDGGGGNYWKELLNRIRDIRSSEKALYRQVLDLYATSIDYDSKSELSVKLFGIYH